MKRFGQGQVPSGSPLRKKRHPRPAKPCLGCGTVSQLHADTCSACASCGIPQRSLNSDAWCPACVEEHEIALAWMAAHDDLNPDGTERVAPGRGSEYTEGLDVEEAQ
jgi:ribosomal protein L37E